ncbi:MULTISPECIES: KTSC domain-containing protein [unclassified Bradyrhizobium]|uniref:KTSC domain-containing protein n=1 Tax=unclassified Bradyrhizobium TaxID=2631580 RepID=UPI0029164979|nr:MULTISPECIES: KTSC domain-containing protein [unclassified Bradyrhizobium]
MDFIYVDSKSVDQIAYDEEQGEAHVIFQRGAHYIYSGVTQEVWDRFRDSTSKGTFVNEEFKAKGYTVRRA